MTDDMNFREKNYYTHNLHKHKVVIFKKTNNPRRFETCLKSILYDNRYKDNKDFYVCTLSFLKKSFSKCASSIKQMENYCQTGGGFDFINILVPKLLTKVSNLEKGIKRCDKELNPVVCKK